MWWFGDRRVIRGRLGAPGAGVAVALEIVTQPSGAVGGVPLTQQPVVRAVDASGRVVPSVVTNITATSHTHAITGTNPVTTVGGVATFTNMTLADTPFTPATSDQITFSAPGLTPVVSNPLTVALGNDMGAWYFAGATNNVENGFADITQATDQTGFGRHLATAGGIIRKLLAALNGEPAFDFTTVGSNFMSDLVLPVQGSLTFFGVLKFVATADYQCVFDAIANAQAWFFWDQPTNKYQVDGRLVGVAVAGTYATFQIHYYTVGADMWIAMRVNGVEILNQIANPAGTPVPGAVGVPVNKTFPHFHRGVLFAFKSYIPEWGYFTLSKRGTATEATTDSYLRVKYATW